MTQTKKTTPEVSPEENVEIKTTHLADGSTVVEKSFSKMIPPPPNRLKKCTEPAPRLYVKKKW
jgi:hypothetical protein